MVLRLWFRECTASFFDFLERESLNSEMLAKFLRDILQQKPVKQLEFTVQVDAVKVVNVIKELTDPVYQQQILKHCLKVLDHSAHDEIYQLLGHVFSKSDGESRKVIYVLPNEHRIVLEENKAIASHGTTGLVTWPPSLFMIEYLFNIGFKENSKVLELGSGIGLLALVLEHLGCTVTATDHHPLVLERLNYNIRTNQSSVEVMNLDWRNDVKLKDYDLIIGADIVFDPDLIEPLVKLLRGLLRKPMSYCLMAVTQRNHQTFTTFLDLVVQFCQITRLESTQDWFYYRESSPILIYKLVSSQMCASD